MTFDRKAKRRYTGKGPGGRPRCRWCGVETPPHRRTWCSEACVEEFKIRAWPHHARLRVWERDHGICAECGFDGDQLRRLKIAHLDTDRHWQQLDRAKSTLRERGYDPARALWEADHILPVVEGGGACGLDNLRTLCQLCHARATADLARRRASARRPPGPSILPLLEEILSPHVAGPAGVGPCTDCLS